MSKPVANAFDWKGYTDEQHAKHGDPFASIKINAKISKGATKGLDKVREKNPNHGTMFGITVKKLNLKAPEIMRNPNAKTKK